MARLKWEYKDKVIRFSVSHEGQESEFYIDPRLVTYLTEGKKIYASKCMFRRNRRTLTCLSGNSLI